MFTVTYDWYDEAKTILLVRINPDSWRWEDAYTVVKHQVAMMRDIPHEVHTIFLFITAPKMPTDKNMFTHLKNLMNTRASNEGLSIFIGTNRLFRDFLMTAGRISHLRWLIAKYRYVTTLEQALAEIEAYQDKTDSYA